MTIEAIAAVGATEVAPLAVPPLADVSAGGLFESALDHFQQLNTQLAANQSSVAQMALGKYDNLHQVMMASEETRLQFELLMSVRNRALEAYQELIRMQV